MENIGLSDLKLNLRPPPNLELLMDNFDTSDLSLNNTPPFETSDGELRQHRRVETTPHIAKL